MSTLKTTTISPPQLVRIHDPDFDTPTLVEAWLHGIDQQNGDRLVKLEGEPQALRRVKAEHVFTRPVLAWG